ncbi:phosphoglucosamine mutase [Nitrososphaera sp.]|uniref:phosphoglucosamine mutase n=1 Tax=Nitrososphaera sp. TaxID=1971748 RepID=UPI002ED7FA35
MQRQRLFGTNGVRGVYGKDLTNDLVIDLTYAMATYYGKGPLVVGYDGRRSSPAVSVLVRSTLNSAGLDVGYAGLMPTPCLQLAAKSGRYNGGIMITASHNPPEYNGLKLTAPDGVEISREDELKVEDIYYEKRFATTDGHGREYADENVIPSYTEKVLSLVDAEKIQSKRFTLAMDLGNGVQALCAPAIAQKLGCRVIAINGNIDSDFPGRESEPTPDNLGVLSEAVRSGKADFGVAFDGDGDRSIFCDNNGSIYWGDVTGALLIKNLLAQRHPCAEIVCPVNTSMVLSKVAEEVGLKVAYTKVGSVEVSREMVNRKAPLGLEENGGFMYGPLNEVRDGSMTTALVLNMLASAGESFSNLVEMLPRTFKIKTKFSLSSREVVSKVMKACVEHGSPKKIETMDGAKIWIDDETWLMVRPSGTEPLIRMYAESTDKSLLDSKVDEYSRIVRASMSDLKRF